MFSPSKKFVPQLHMASSTGIMLLPNGVSEYSIRIGVRRYAVFYDIKSESRRRKFERNEFYAVSAYSVRG